MSFNIFQCQCHVSVSLLCEELSTMILLKSNCQKKLLTIITAFEVAFKTRPFVCVCSTQRQNVIQPSRGWLNSVSNILVGANWFLFRTMLKQRD